MYAADAPQAAGSCTILPADLAAITAAQAQGVTAELAARKALLTRVITCANIDAQTLETQLHGTSVADGATALQSQLEGKLADATNYYTLELTKLNDAGIAGTKAIAGEVLSWRSGNYDPLAAQIANFILWSDNQNLFATAGARLIQMENIVSFIVSAGPNNQLQSDLAAAQVSIEDAKNENEAAKNALVQLLPASQSLAFIQQSLRSLSDSYQKFSDIGTVAQTLLSAQSVEQ